MERQKVGMKLGSPDGLTISGPTVYSLSLLPEAVDELPNPNQHL